MKQPETGAEVAARISRNLKQLQAVRNCAAQLFARDQLGRDFFKRGDLSEIPKTASFTLLLKRRLRP